MLKKFGRKPQRLIQMTRIERKIFDLPNESILR